MKNINSSISKLSFKILKNCYNFSTTGLHPYLEQGLRRKGYLPLKQIQVKSFNSSLQKNVFLNSCTGSGKTLSYLVPIFNRILSDQDQNINNQKQQHGAVILTLNKELCTQVYRQSRILDFGSRINIVRTGPVSHLTPIIDILSKPNLSQQQQNQIQQKSQINVSNTVKWQKTDILISTPQLLSNILSYTRKTPINPKIIAIDEADLLLQLDKNVASHTNKVIRQIQNKNQGNKMRYIITGSSFPPKMAYKKDRQQTQFVLQQRFKPIDMIQGQEVHKLPQKTQLYFIDMTQNAEKSKIQLMIDIINKRLPRKIIIFCSSKENVMAVVQSLKQNVPNSNPVSYYAGLNANQRSHALFQFQNQDKNVLVSTDLGSRGLDFKRPVDLVVQYDMAENVVNFVNRAGRTGRNGLPGQIITFVQEKNKDFFTHLQSLQEQNQQFDQLFSRKRSYSKYFKRQNAKDNFD